MGGRHRLILVVLTPSPGPKEIQKSRLGKELPRVLFLCASFGGCPDLRLEGTSSTLPQPSYLLQFACQIRGGSMSSCVESQFDIAPAALPRLQHELHRSTPCESDRTPRDAGGGAGRPARACGAERPATVRHVGRRL